MRRLLLLPAALFALGGCSLIVRAVEAERCDFLLFDPRCDDEVLVTCVDGFESRFTCELPARCDAENITCNTCGDGILFSNPLVEECDDDNNDNDDGCSAQCVAEVCGDGILHLELGERCDDGNLDDDDGCDADCTTDIVQVATGRQFACALSEDNRVRCWGVGQAELGIPGAQSIQPEDYLDGEFSAVEIGATVLQLVAGDNHVCALLEGGAVRCWGDNLFGQLGLGNFLVIGDDETPAEGADVSLGAPALSLAAGGNNTCALLEGGVVRCWGDNAQGQLGLGINNGALNRLGDNEAVDSVPPVALGAPAVALSLAGNHTCAVLSDATLRCWGRNFTGQLGLGNTGTIGDNESPGSVAPVPVGPVAAVTVGGNHTCALLLDGSVRCWGRNESGQLGRGNTIDLGDNEAVNTENPVDIGAAVAALCAGDDHSCALLDTGDTRCWGEAGEGALGYGNENDIGDNELPSAAGPLDLGGLGASLVCSEEMTCVLQSDGQLRCWGNNGAFQLGVGEPNQNIGDNELPTAFGTIPVF